MGLAQGLKCAIILAMIASKDLNRSWARLSGYVWLGLVGQLLWGSYPPVAKRAFLEVPKFSLLLLSTLVTAGVGLGVMRREDPRPVGEILRFLWREKALWGMALFAGLRSVTNVVAIDLTRATWVQLIYLLTPFMVAILGRLVFGEPTPPFTYPALFLSTVGAALALVSDWSHVGAGFTPSDLLGLGVAGLSMLALATYFQLVRRSSQRAAGRGLILFQQGAMLVLVYLGLTWGTGEDWTAWRDLSLAGWGAVLWVVGGVFVLANLLQITALGGANAALITSLMPLRLISAIALGWWLLHERLHTPWQWLGAGMVLVTVSVYLGLQGGSAHAQG